MPHSCWHYVSENLEASSSTSSTSRLRLFSRCSRGVTSPLFTYHSTSHRYHTYTHIFLLCGAPSPTYSDSSSPSPTNTHTRTQIHTDNYIFSLLKGAKNKNRKQSLSIFRNSTELTFCRWYRNCCPDYVSLFTKGDLESIDWSLLSLSMHWLSMGYRNLRISCDYWESFEML